MSNITFQPLGSPMIDGKLLGKTADIDPRLSRTHYFDGRLLTAEDLTRDQIYLDQRLREVGRFLGSGIMKGLELSFDRSTDVLTLSPGYGLSHAGRVLELQTPLQVDLSDRALISKKNDGRFQQLSRALYAVVLQYVDVATDVAEVFPTDLGAKRGFDYDIVTEAVQMGLVPLPIPLPQQGELTVRARLMRELWGSDRVQGMIPEDSVALGVLAIQNDRPQWLDAELLRQPVRNVLGLGDRQADMARQYERLIRDVLKVRVASGMNGDFSAESYFQMIPPVGTIPADAVDPVTGRQGYFKEGDEIWIAPVRSSDLELIKKESMGLPPIDLRSNEPTEIVVLAPLSNAEFGYYSRALVRNTGSNPRLLPQLDLLKLKLYPTRPVHQLDTDADAWRAIWERVDKDALIYVRRPTRAVETTISSIVIARGTSLPPNVSASPGPADTGGLVEDEQTVFLRRMSLRDLVEIRPPEDEPGRVAREALVAGYAGTATIVIACWKVLLRIERRYDKIVWQTLLALAQGGVLTAFVEQFLGSDEPSASTGKRVAALGQSLGLATELTTRWIELDS